MAAEHAGWWRLEFKKSSIQVGRLERVPSIEFRTDTWRTGSLDDTVHLLTLYPGSRRHRRVRVRNVLHPRRLSLDFNSWPDIKRWGTTVHDGVDTSRYRMGLHEAWFFHGSLMYSWICT